jgi:DNA-binding CsgD family transcriptional regulator
MAVLFARKPAVTARIGSVSRDRDADTEVEIESESKAFESALESTSCSLLFVTGHTGVGRTSLLREYQRIAEELGHAVHYALAADLVRRADDDTLARGLPEGFGAGERPRPVLLVDGYEQLTSVEPWLFERIGSALPEDVLLVMASRSKPPLRLTLDRGWVGLTRIVELKPWTDVEMKRFLDVSEVPEPAQRALMDATGGYPLATALAVDVLRDEPAAEFGLEQARAMQARLAHVLVTSAHEPVQQLALDVCALAQTTSVELLEHVLRSNALHGSTNAHELYEWLAAQSFVERSASGLRPHLLARLSLIARVRRDQKYQAVFRPVREFCIDQLASGSVSEAGLGELFFLDRDVPFVRERKLTTSEQSSFVVTAPAKHDALVELVRRHEGDEAAELCRARLRVEPDAFETPREDPLDRMLHSLSVYKEQDVLLADRDPAARLARQYLRAHPPEDGAPALFLRWFMEDTGYQSPTPSVLSVVARLTQIVLATERVAYSLCVYREPDEWTAMWDSASAPREVVGRFELGRHRYSLMAFSYTERSLRDRLVDAWKVPSTPVASQTQLDASREQRSKIKQRVAEIARKSELTAREAEVLELLGLGSSFEEIARKLKIRPRTVKFHQENLLRKTGAATRMDLLRRLI